MKKILTFILSALFFYSNAQQLAEDARMNQAKRVIFSTYGDRVYIKDKFLLKFGRNTDLGTSKETVWQSAGSNETYLQS